VQLSTPLLGTKEHFICCAAVNPLAWYQMSVMQRHWWAYKRVTCYSKLLLAESLTDVCQLAALRCAALCCAAYTGFLSEFYVQDRSSFLVSPLSTRCNTRQGVQSNVHDCYHHCHLQTGHRAAMSHHCLSHDHCSSPLPPQPRSSASYCPPLFHQWPQHLQTAASRFHHFTKLS